MINCIRVYLWALVFRLGGNRVLFYSRQCGCCAYVCPAKRPLTQGFKEMKRRVGAERRAAQAKAKAEAEKKAAEEAKKAEEVKK